MSQTEHRYDRLAVRLSLIISRLLAGETLSVKTLAVEFGGYLTLSGLAGGRRKRPRPPRSLFPTGRYHHSAAVHPGTG